MQPGYLKVFLLTLTLLLLPALPVQAAGAHLTVGDCSGAVGEEVIIPVEIENPSSLAGGSFNLYYDPEILTAVRVSAGEVLKNNMLESNLNYQGRQGKALRVVWAGSRGITNDGILCTVTFKLLQNGSSQLELGEVELFDSNLQAIAASSKGGTLVAGTGQKLDKPASSNPEDSKTAAGENGTGGTAGNPIPPFSGSQSNAGKQAEPNGPAVEGKLSQQLGQQNSGMTASKQSGNDIQPGSSNIAGNTFADTVKHWARNYIEKMVQKQIMAGYQDGSFKPDNNITRAEFARVIVLAMQLQVNQEDSLDFVDQEQVGDWARPYIAAAVKAGIISGYSDGSFQPAQSISRAEMAVMISRARKMQLASEAALSFDDSAQIPDWARPYVASVLKAGIISGKDNNRFAPLEPATRAEAATIIARMLE